MSVSINIANLVSVEMDGKSGFFVLDPATGRAYSLSVEEVEPSVAGRIAMAAMGQSRAEMFEVPRDQIAEVMKAKDEVMEGNRKSFGGHDYARG